ncbi:MAG: hypothetical protein R3B48_16090 [Kofleriaceae bacterium]
MRSLVLMLLVATASLVSACESRDPTCDRLAEKCAYCTLPGLRATCEAAVDSNDAASCQDGLDDPDVRSNCVPPSSGSGSDGGPDGPPSTGGALCGRPNECICPSSSSCNYGCLPGSLCKLDCQPGSACGATCSSTAPCHVQCAASTRCDVACGSGNCEVACPSTGCTVTGCPAGSCTVTCGGLGTPTRSGDTVTCP